MTTSVPLLLASASPRRRQLLSLLGLPYSVCVSPVDEDAVQARYQGAIEGLAQWLAEQKAAGVLQGPEHLEMRHSPWACNEILRFAQDDNCQQGREVVSGHGNSGTSPYAGEHVVITADTTVLLGGEVLGKPRDKAHARELLLSLRNRWHRVVTGVAVGRIIEGRPVIRSASCRTPVLMRPYSEEDVAAYIATGDPLDKAGAYGIQHPQFQPTARINGCYLNVVGLPLCVVVQLLAGFDVHPLVGGRKATGCPWSEQCQVQQGM